MGSLESIIRNLDMAELEAPRLSAKPASAFVWRTEVRISDCDLLQHINNAEYGSLMEAARWAAAEAGIFRKNKAALGSAQRVCIDYVGQPVDIAVWWDGDANAIGFEF